LSATGLTSFFVSTGFDATSAGFGATAGFGGAAGLAFFFPKILSQKLIFHTYCVQYDLNCLRNCLLKFFRKPEFKLRGCNPSWLDPDDRNIDPVLDPLERFGKIPRMGVTIGARREVSGRWRFCISSITAGPKPSSANRGFPHPAITISEYSIAGYSLDELLSHYLVVFIHDDHVGCT
jgi:hypothetical protein